MLAININSIPAKNGLTKPRAPDPLRHVGVNFSESGLTATLYEKINGKWHEYEEIDGRASFKGGPVPARYRGKGFHPGEFFPTYDWVADKGYENFASRVD